MRYQHPDGRLLDATEEDYESTFKAQGFEPVEPTEAGPDLEKLTRDDLNALATDKGIADPAALPNKAAVIEEIEGGPPPQE